MESYTRSVSQTSTWEFRKILVRRNGPSSTAPKASSSRRLAPWDRRSPLTIQVKYRGGPEAWIEIKARGETLRVPGSVCLFDALSAVWGSDR